MILLYVWMLISAPRDQLVCAIWTGQEITPQVMNAAGCRFAPSDAGGWMALAMDVTTHEIACQWPAADLPALGCDLHPIDQYQIQVHNPHEQHQLCVVTISHAGEPTDEEISGQCGDLNEAYTMQWVSTGTYATSTPPAPVCPMPQLTPDEYPPSADGLATANDYQLLSQKLYWYFGRTDMVIPWQNRWDVAIYDAGLGANVPPAVIKRMIARETQFWPLWDQRIDADLGEAGMGQLTDAGADLVLRYSARLYDRFCPLAAWASCDRGYDLLSPVQRQMLRNVLRRDLLTFGAVEDAAAMATAQIPIWADVLAAWYCAAGEAVGGWSNRPADDRWNITLAAYHAGPDCIRGGTICLEGVEYVEMP